MSENLVSVEGTVRFMRTEREDGDACRCCDGPHVFARYIEVPAPPNYRVVRGLPRPNDWLQEALFDERLENRRVRVTMELLPEEDQ